MQISELAAALSKVQSIVGDAEVIFKAVEGDAETVLHDIQLTLRADGTTASTVVALNHGAAPETPAQDAAGISEAEAAPAETGGTPPAQP